MTGKLHGCSSIIPIVHLLIFPRIISLLFQMFFPSLFWRAVSPRQPGVYLWTVPMTRMTRGEGSWWLMKWGRIIKQNSLHLEKLVLCGSLLLCSVTLQKQHRAQRYLRQADLSKGNQGSVLSGGLSLVRGHILFLRSHFQNINSVHAGVWATTSGSAPQTYCED